MDGADVGMIQGRSGLRFTLKAGQCLSVAGHFIGQELESNKTMQSRVLRLVDNAHPAATEFFKDAVVRDDLSDQ